MTATTRPTPDAPEHRDAALDGLRGIAILSILVLHYFVYPVVRGDLGVVSTAVRFAGIHLWSGVDLFFVLSGYFIASSLLRTRAGASYYAEFAIRRSFRILPLYLVLLATFFAVSFAWAQSPLVAHSYAPLSYATFTQNFFLASSGHYGGDLMAATWSLAIEVQFYVLVPFLLRRADTRVVIAMSLALAAASAAARGFFAYPASYAYPFCRGDALFAGVAIAAASEGPRGVALRAWIRGHLGRLGALAVCAYALAAWAAPAPGSVHSHLLFTVAFALAVSCAVACPGGAFAKCLTQRWLMWLGRGSYGLYLFHYGILSAVFLLANGGEPQLRGLGDAMLVAGALCACIALVHVLRRAIELPAIDAGHKLAAHARPSQAVAA